MKYAALLLVLVGFSAIASAQPIGSGSDGSDGSAAIESSGSAGSAAAVADATTAPSSSTPTRPEAQVAALSPTSGYKDGFILAAGDGSSKLYIGGIAQFDGRVFVDDNPDPASDEFYFQTLRIDLRGTLFDHYDFRFLPDFAGGKLVVQDAYIDIRYSDLVKLRIGKTKVPFGIERLQNETSTTFAQRGLPNNLVPNRDLGLELFGDLDLATAVISYQLGIFNGVADGGSGDGDLTNGKEGAARLFIRPLAHGPRWLQNLGFGGATTFGDKDANIGQPDTPQWKTQAQTTIFQFKVGPTDTLADTVVADGYAWRATAQGYWYAGPLGALAEYVRTSEAFELAEHHTRVVADSWQAVGQWVITGDDATYNSVTPRHPFDPHTGDLGAFDVVARVGELRLVDDAAFAAKIADPTKSIEKAWSAGAGLDWFANKAFRAVVDLERTWFTLGAKTGTATSDRPTETSIIARAQLAF